MASMIAPKMALRAFKAAPKVAPWTKLSAQLPRAQPAFRRFFAAAPQEQPRLRLGSTGMIEQDHDHITNWHELSIIN